MASPRPLGHAALPISEWPGADRAAYARACTPGDPFDAAGPAARWRPRTHLALTGAYARWLGYLLSQACVLGEEAPPDRVTPDRIAGYARFLTQRCAPVTVSSYLGQLHMMLRDVWPERTWRWLCDLQARYQRFAEPSRNKAARIVPQQDLLLLGCDLMREATALAMPDNLKAGPGHPALIYRDGLLIALLAMRPLRQTNLLGLQLSTGLRRTGAGWTIQIPASESKTHVALNMAVPDILVAPLENYLATYRPRLLTMRGPSIPVHPSQRAGAHLWVTRCGTSMGTGALQKALERHTRRRFGHHVNVHLFRDCAATSMADDDPGFVRLAADLLGHRSFQTTETHYINGNQRRALQHCQNQVLLRRRAANKRPLEARRRRGYAALPPATAAEDIF